MIWQVTFYQTSLLMKSKARLSHCPFFHKDMAGHLSLHSSILWAIILILLRLQQIPKIFNKKIRFLDINMEGVIKKYAISVHRRLHPRSNMSPQSKESMVSLLFLTSSVSLNRSKCKDLGLNLKWQSFHLNKKCKAQCKWHFQMWTN